MAKQNQSNNTQQQTGTVNESDKTVVDQASGDTGVGVDTANTAGAADTSSTGTNDAQGSGDAAGAAAIGDGEGGTKEDAGGDAGAAGADVAGATATGADAGSADPDTGTTDTGAAKDPVVDPAAPPAPAPAPAPADAPAAPVVEAVELIQRGGATTGVVVATGETATQEQLAAAINAQANGTTASPAAFAAAVSDTIAKEAAASGIVVKDVDEEAATGSFYEQQALSNNSVSWMRRLEEYISAMDPRRPMDQANGVPHQKTLYRVLSWVINSSPDAEFQTLLGMVLQQFDKHANGVFHETAVNRFPEHLTMNADERSTFFQLLNLMNIGADVKGREQRLKQLDFNRMFTKIPLDQITEQGRQRILGYFGK